MIFYNKTGTLVAGPLTRDPEIKETKSGKLYLNLNVKGHSVKDESGRWDSVFVDCCIWRDLERWDGLLHKGDFVIVVGRELKRHPSANGKIYWNLDAEGVFADGLVNAGWVQIAIDMGAGQQPAQAESDEFTQVEDETPFDPPPAQPVQTSLDGGQMYSGERLADYAPQRPAPAVGTPETDALINDDADDLPF